MIVFSCILYEVVFSKTETNITFFKPKYTSGWD